MLEALESLQELLIQRLGAGEARQMARRLPQGDRICAEVAWQAGDAPAIASLVEHLERRNAIDDYFFVELAFGRPDLIDDLRRLAPRFGVAAFDALVPTPAQLPAACASLMKTLGLPDRVYSRLSDDDLHRLQDQHPQHRLSIRGFRAGWRAARTMPEPPPARPRGVTNDLYDEVSDIHRLWTPREPAALEISENDPTQRGWVAVIGPRPDPSGVADLRFVEAIAALRAVLLRESPEPLGAWRLDGLRLAQRVEWLVLVDTDQPRGLLTALGFLARWMAPLPIVGGIAFGEFRPLGTPFLHRDLGGSGPLRASLLARDALLQPPSGGSGCEVRVAHESWTTVAGAIQQVLGARLPDPRTGERCAFDPWLLGDEEGLLALGRRLVPPASDQELTALAEATRPTKAFGVEFALVEADEGVNEGNHARLTRLMDTLQEVAEQHLPALIRTGRDGAREPGRPLIQVRERLLCEPTHAGLRIICVDFDRAAVERQTDPSLMSESAGARHPHWLLDWLTTVVAELEARRVPVRLGVAIASVRRLSSPHAAAAGRPWLSKGDLPEQLRDVCRLASARRAGEEIHLRPAITAEALRWLGMPQEGLDQLGHDVYALSREVLDDIERRCERCVVHDLGLRGGRLMDRLDLAPALFNGRVRSKARIMAERVLVPAFSDAIYTTLRRAERDGRVHAYLQAWLYVLVSLSWAVRRAGVNVEVDGPKLAVVLAVELVAVYFTSLVVTRICARLYERFVVLRVLPVLHRYHFTDLAGEVMERVSLRMRAALSLPTFSERLRALVAAGGWVSPLMWYRFVLRPWHPAPATPENTWPSLRRPVPKARLHRAPNGVALRANGESPTEATQWHPSDVRPDIPQDLAALCGIVALLSLLGGSQVSAGIWTLAHLPGDPAHLFLGLGFVTGSLYAAAFYTRLTRVDLSALYLRRPRPLDLDFASEMNSIFSFLTGLVSFLTLMLLAAGVEPMLRQSLDRDDGFGVAVGFVSLLALSLVPMGFRSNRAAWLLLGVSLIVTVAALWQGLPALAGWSLLYAGLCMISINIVLAYTPYMRLEQAVRPCLDDPASEVPRVTEQVALFPPQAWIRSFEMHRRLAVRALGLLGDFAEVIHRQVGELARPDRPEAGWFLCDQHGQIIAVGGPGAHALGWLGRRLSKAEDLFDGGDRSAGRLALLVRHALPGQRLEVMVLPRADAPSPRRPCRLFVEVIDADRVSAGYLGVMIPTARHAPQAGE